MQRRDKVRVQELADYFEHHGQVIEQKGGKKELVLSGAYIYFSNQLRALLAGRPTIAQGFTKPKDHS